ncbi:MAG: KH domain-containing protein [Thermoleophilia bacterium]|nr:KH domain-containing protein [Thermoleophilia bacterium]
MTELVDYLARRLVDERDAVRVESYAREDEVVLRLHVAPADRGKVIGRQGRIVRALRTVLRAAGGRARRRVLLEIAD